MRCKCKHNRPEFSGKKINGGRAARQRCLVCGKFYHDGWGCIPLAEWRSCCEPSAVERKRKPERRGNSPVESKCDPGYRDESPIGSECQPDLTECEDGCETECCADPWVYEQECFMLPREENFMEEAVFAHTPNFTGLLSDELPGDPH